MAGNPDGYRHDTPHRTVTANSTILGEDADGMALAYDPLCAECERVGFCTWDQGPCSIDGPDVPLVTDAERREALDTASSASRQHYIDTGRYLAEGEAIDGPVYSYTVSCPVCGEVHPT